MIDAPGRRHKLQSGPVAQDVKIMPGSRFSWIGPLLAVCMFAVAATAGEPAKLKAARESLVAQIVASARATGSLTGRPNLNPNVLKAIREVPRHQFVPDHVARFAYHNTALPAGHGLRESQPFLVALMTDLVAPQSDDDVLILGIGGGYHAALASTIVNKVFCLELNKDAAFTVTHRLRQLGYTNIETRVADPYYGWPDSNRRFDAIIVRLAIEFVPQTVLSQLKPGGRLVAPIGRSDVEQHLTLVTKSSKGKIRKLRILPVRFMRLPGGERI